MLSRLVFVDASGVSAILDREGGCYVLVFNAHCPTESSYGATVAWEKLYHGSICDQYGHE